jgi:hypothetical protein
MRDEKKAIADTVRIAQSNLTVVQILEEDSQISNDERELREKPDAIIPDKHSFFKRYTKEEFQDPNSNFSN